MKVTIRSISILFGLTAMAMNATPLCAAIQTFNSTTSADNASERSAWLAAIGVSAPENLVDFEVGLTALQNISGVGGLFPDGLVITDTGSAGTPSAIIRTGDDVIGNSNPVGVYSVTHDEQAYLELDFSIEPVDYVALQDIDTSGTDIVVTFVGGASFEFSIESTASGGDSAQFVGIFRNDMPQITLVQLDASGDGRWGIDTIEYGQVPEPSGLALVSFALLAAAGSKRSRLQ